MGRHLRSGKQRRPTSRTSPSDDPIWIEVGVPGLGGGLRSEFVVSDGNHRLAAAIIRDDPVRASFSGSWDRFVELFADATFDGILEDEQPDHPMFC